MTVVAIRVNDKPVRRDVPPRMHLADFIRDEARQTGTHLGCEHGVCGACTVLVDDQPVRSCITFAVACDGRAVTTVEGYDHDPVMALLRPAFSKHHGLQCGFCTPGMLTTARDIVLRFPDADERKVRFELSSNLCRCTGYMGITNAVLDVLAQTRGDTHPAIAALRTSYATVPRPEAAAAGAACSGTCGRESKVAGFAAFEPKDVGPVLQPVEAAPQAAEAPAATVPEGGTRITGAFEVPHAADAVWAFMSDLPAVAGCLPGAELTEQVGETVKGKVAIKFGPMSANFQGHAKLRRDDDARSAVLQGTGQDSISKSRANGDVSYRVVPAGDARTRVEVELLYSLQGPLAQFSRSGLVKDFVGRLLQEFGKNVSRRMDPRRAADEPLAPAQLNAFSLGLSVLWSRIKRMFGKQD